MGQCLDTCSHSTRQWLYDIRQSPLLLAWNLTAILSVLVPLITYWICASRNPENDDNGWTWWWNNNNENNNDNERGWWYNLWSGGEERRDEEQGSGALVFVYLWTLVMFVILVYYGHGHIKNTSDNRTFLLALIMFANLAFVACILTACSMQMDERQVEERGFFGVFAMCMVVTFALWTFLCAVFCGILYKPNQKEYDGRASDYQRQTDGDRGWWKKKQEAKEESSWMSGWNSSEQHSTTGTGIKVKTAADDEKDEPMAPLKCFGSEKRADKRQGSMA